jgi:hypothetical protein
VPVSWIRILFIVSGLYDGLLGAVFLFASATVFRVARVIPPNHFGYIQFPALLLIVFGVMFLRIAANPIKRREQILYGVALKCSYAGLVFWYQFHGGIPAFWIPWAWADAGFMLLFLWAWGTLPRLQDA